MAILSDMRIVECGAFIAGPFSTMSLAELGAEVVRIDPLKGGMDYRRWPVTASGQSLYWAGLNKGKKSVAIDTSLAEGQELAQAIITAPGEDRGLFVSNFPAHGWLAYDVLKALRSDLIMVNIVGSRDGSTALDYTVNCAVGFPAATGPVDGDQPVNHVFPAWDFICGQTAATALLAAERYRRRGGPGQHMRIALADIALAIVADMGFVAEVEINGQGRQRYGNHIYGAFGRDFATRDGRRVMVAAVSSGQWKSLCKATGIDDAVSRFEARNSVDLAQEADRFEAREAIASWIEPWFSARTLDEARATLNAHRVCWGPYQNFDQLVTEDPRCSVDSELFARVHHPGIGSTLTPRSPIDFSACEPVPPQAGPLLGQHTDEVLHQVLGLDSASIAALHDRKIVGGSKCR
ncbi:MAG TPA: CoA transferase [Sphingomonas sp.]|nr:CoA transferase [Sphingomonas sp.]